MPDPKAPDGLPLRLDPGVESADPTRPAFLSRPAGAPVSNYDVSPKIGEFVMLAADDPFQPRLTVALNSTPSVSRRADR